MDYIHFVYLTTNKINGKIYVGQHTTTDIDDKYLGSGTWLKRAVSKYGTSAFSRDILEVCSPDCLDSRETFWIGVLSACNPEIGYNIAIHGSAPMRGRCHTPEAVIKIKNTRHDIRGDKNPMFGKFGELNPNFGNGHLLSGSLNPFYGKQHTEETKKAISIRNSGEGNYFWKKKRPDHSAKMKGKNNSNKQYVIVLKSPTGELVETSCLTHFCREYSLCSRSVRHLCYRRKRGKTYKGWSCQSVVINEKVR